MATVWRDHNRINLSIIPLVNYIESVRAKTDGSLGTLSTYFGVSVRHLSRYISLTKDGHIMAKVPVIPLSFVDDMLTYAGDETLHTLWDFDELDGNYRPVPRNHPRCKRCNNELVKVHKAKLCGFCLEETTGRTLTYRQREMY
jgi:hypothetical protein